VWGTGRPLFADRTEAGRRLADRLAQLRDQDVVVLGLPRGGGPVAAEVARRLGAPLDVLVVRKLGGCTSRRWQVYADFRPVPEEEIMALLGRSVPPAPARVPAGDDPPLRDEEVEVAVGPVLLAGRLTVPEHPLGVVVFAHGSGSSRHSPRHRYVARVLQEFGLATLLFDLLTPDGEADRANVVAGDLLADRLTAVLGWVREQPECRGLPVGLFGASTGTAAALWAAAAPEADIAAIVSRGGRPDLAGPRLERVQAPTLLIVGGRDDVLLQLNEAAAARLRCEHRVVRVSGATHLFEEPGTLELAARLAREWFVAHLSRAGVSRG